MGLTIINYGGYVCDKCGHKWVTKSQKSVGKYKDYEKVKVDLRIKKPKMCPKCKSQKWNYLGLTSSELDKDIVKMIPKEDQKLYAESIKVKTDMGYRIKIVREEISVWEKKVKKHEEVINTDTELLHLAKEELKDLREELQDLEKIKGGN